MRPQYHIPLLILTFTLFSLPKGSTAQTQSVGIFLNTAASYDGYTLLAPLQDSTTYLLDNCGRIVNSWNSTRMPALSAYLLPDGSLLRPTKVTNSTFGNQSGGRIEKVDWDGNLLWEYTYSTPTLHQHHDIEPMANGNVLLLAFEYKTREETIAAGRDTNIARKGLWAEHIVEVRPIGADSGEIIWEWHAWDHMVQEYDSSRSNYGSVAAHPELLNINYRPSHASVGDTADWMHANSISYNSDLDQIVMSSRTFSELIIIDHQTTITEAASHSGGNRGRGGDIIYRWGNPEACSRGTLAEQKLFFQHDVSWIPAGYPGAGNLLLFNNGIARPGTDYSSIEELVTSADSNGNYPVPAADTYGPATVVWTYTSSPVDSFYSAIISGTQRLPNGNTLICEGTTGHLFEVNPAGVLLWDYINPVNRLGRLKQGDFPKDNNVFRAYRYGRDYPAFTGRDLSPKGYVELNPFNYNCSIYADSITNVAEAGASNKSIIVYPNPAAGKFCISAGNEDFYRVTLTDLMGREVMNVISLSPDYEVSICDIVPGMYICTISDPKGENIKICRLLTIPEQH
jgi:hypothetical protein